MPEVLDLSTLRNGPPKPQIDGLPEDQQEALSKMAENNPQPEGEEVRTAFLVFVTKDGSTVAVPDLDYAVVRDHLPSTDDIYGAVQVIAKDIQVSEAAVHTAQYMQQLAMSQMQARQNQQLASQLNLKGGK